MAERIFDIIVIGGSAGSVDIVISLLKSIPKDFRTPIILVIHRLKNTTSSLDVLLAKATGGKKVIEPEDKEPIRPGMIYLTPQNYHLLVEKDLTFSLDYSKPVNFSRPSIDISFESVAAIFKERTLAILLSGANKDGAEGLKTVILKGGLAVIQDPETAEYPVMPQAGIHLNNQASVQKPEQILNCILHKRNN